MTLELRCDARGVVNRLWPHLEQALEDELFTEQEVADLLTDEIVDTIEFVEIT